MFEDGLRNGGLPAVYTVLTGATRSFWTPGASFFAIAFTRLHGRTLRPDAVTSSTLMSALGRTGRWRQVLEMTRGGCGRGEDGSRLVLKHGLKMG